MFTSNFFANYHIKNFSCTCFAFSILNVYVYIYIYSHSLDSRSLPSCGPTQFTWFSLPLYTTGQYVLTFLPLTVGVLDTDSKLSGIRRVKTGHGGAVGHRWRPRRGEGKLIGVAGHTVQSLGEIRSSLQNNFLQRK